MIPFRALPRALSTIWRTFGLRGAAFRSVHEARRATGAFRAKPRHRVAFSSPAKGAFHVDGALLASSMDKDEAIRRAEIVVGGQYYAYGWQLRDLPASSEEWSRNFRTGFTYPAANAWWTIAHLDPAAGDIKDVWEPARFGWAYDLVRGYATTRDERYVRAFAEQFTSWASAGAPFNGVHWSCGQETAIRAIALLYAEANLGGAEAFDRPLQERLIEILAASGERIADALHYAISQRNNHAISEAAGLVALGVRLSGVHPDAEKWLERGEAWINRLVQEQFAPDGWYVQHSFTYLRLALDQCVVAERSLRSVHRHLSPPAVARLQAATQLLLAVIDPPTGIVPNHGANDGALVHPIGMADYRDFRVAITAACSTFNVAMPADVSVSDEALAWLGAESPRRSPPISDGVTHGPSGWVAARAGGNFAFLRAARYDSRPSHLDPLHVDIRIGGQEVVVDPGSFAYQAPPPWRNSLVSAQFHNGPMLDDREPGVRGPRFLWYAWPSAAVSAASFTKGTARIEAADSRGVTRRVTISGDAVVVEDEVLPEATNGSRLAVAWLLHPDADPGLVVSEPAGMIIQAVEGSPAGWFSPRYNQRLRSRTLRVEATLGPNTTIRSIFRRPVPRSSTAKLDDSMVAPTTMIHKE